jgi:hypothetical protein
VRKFAAAAVGAAALAATLFGATGTASAASGHQVSSSGGDGAALSARAAATPTRIGKVHKFHAKPIRGASGWGNWYWAKIKGQHAFVIINFYVKDTRADKKNAALCYMLRTTGYPWQDRCIVNTKGNGKTKHQVWRMDYWNHDKLKVQTAVGHLSSDKKVFYISSQGPWLKLRWMS